jgi:hypothetical protein
VHCSQAAAAGTEESACEDVKPAQPSLVPHAPAPMAASAKGATKRARPPSPAIPTGISSAARAAAPNPFHAPATKLPEHDCSGRLTSASRRFCERGATARSICSAAAPPLSRSISSDSYFVSAVSRDPGICLFLALSPRCAEPLLCHDSVIAALSDPAPAACVHPKPLLRLKVPPLCNCAPQPDSMFRRLVCCA